MKLKCTPKLFDAMMLAIFWCLVLISAFAWDSSLSVAGTLAVQDSPDPSASLIATQDEVVEGEQAIILKTTRPTQPAFLYATSAMAMVSLKVDAVEQKIDVQFRIIQGRPNTIRLGLNGPGKVQSVQGDGILAWAVRTAGEQRFLDIELNKEVVEPKATILLQNQRADSTTDIELTHLAPGKSVGFDSKIHLQPTAGLSPRIVQAEGFIRLSEAAAEPAVQSDPQSEIGFQTSTGGKLILRWVHRGAEVLPVEISRMTLDGQMDSTSNSVVFQLQGTAKVSRANAKLRILSGAVALSELPSGDQYRVNLNSNGDQPYYELEFLEAGTYPLELDFVATLLTPQTNWQGIQFFVAANAVVPVSLNGFSEDLQFQREAESVVPTWDGSNWQAFLPASGNVTVQWKNARSTGEGKLFFTSSAQVEAKVGPGLLRQDHHLAYQVLQGQLKSLAIDLTGPGEILNVEGENIVGWKVEEAADSRRLEISLSQPIVGQSQVHVRSQTPLSAFPVKVEGLALKPIDAIRHSGHLRISNTGSVRLTPTDLKGLTQLGPEHFPGEALQARQLFVYRFPSADFGFTIVADRIQPEIHVNELAVYALSQSERVITADMELDIREAGIREWSFSVPEDYSIVAVTGANVADYIVATEATDGRRNLKVIFNQDIQGRQLVSLRMEKNIAAETGPWVLPRIAHPEAKAVRGDIGVVGAPGFRIAAVTTEMLVEKPLSTFPNAVANLQQAFRIRQPEWSATMQIEQLDRSIQSDVFHMYSLSQGSIYGSVLINYFVTGAPTAEWKLNVPAELGNVNVDGQDVRTWRRDGDTLLVTLHQPVMGPYTLLLTFEQKPNETDGSFSAGQVAPLEVQGDRGYVQIVSPMQVEIERQLVSNALLELDPLELPAEFRLLTTAPALGTWQYTQRPFDLNLKVKWFEPGTTASQVVEFSEANSHVSPDGELVTDVVYYVKSRGQRTLRIKLPDDPVRLWAVSVNGQPVTARQAEDMTLIPLPGGADPNVPTEVNLRLGKPAVDGAQPEVNLPTVYAPVLKTQWNVQGDENHVVVRTGGTVEASRPVVWPDGFDWLADRGLWRLGLVGLLVVLTTFLTRQVVRERQNSDTEGATNSSGSSSRVFLASITAGLALALAAQTAWWAFTTASLPSPLQLNLPVLATGQMVGIEVENVPSWQVSFSWIGVALMAGSIFLLGFSCLQSFRLLRNPIRLVALVLLGIGSLLQPNGAIWFFTILALIILTMQFLPALWQWLKRMGGAFQRWRRRSPSEVENTEARSESSEGGPEGGPSAVVTSVLALAMVLGSAWTPATAVVATVPQSNDAYRSADSLTQDWQVSSADARLTVKAKLTVSGRPGDQFVLLKSPAVLADFSGDTLRLTKAEVAGIGLCYIVTIPFDENTQDEAVNSDDAKESDSSSGDDETEIADAPPRPNTNEVNAESQTAKQYVATFEYRVEAINWTAGLPVYTGPAALQKVELTFDQAGWEVTCPAAVRVRNLTETNGETSPATDKTSNDQQTRVELLLRAEATSIQLHPRARNLASEETQFFVEGSQLYTPGPGVVDGRHRLSIRTSQGKLSDLRAIVPAGLTVSAVNGPVTSWRFDADNRHLNLEIDPAAEANFDLLIETQRALDPLPADLKLEPLRIERVNGEVGLLAVAFGSDAQPEKIESEGFSQVNIGDFDTSVVADASAIIQRVYRYGVDAGDLSVRVIPVAAEVRVVSRQVLSLGDERIVLGVNFVAEISRTGLFQLSFPLPDGLEVESLSGESLHHWSELTDDQQRKIVLHLNGKTIGNQTFALVLAGPAPPEVGDWKVPHFEMDEADRQSGDLLIRPIPGIRLRATARQNISELDPRAMGGGQNGAQNTLAFRLLQRDWNLVLGIEKLDPWVTAQVLHEVTLREGQTRSTLMAEVNIENASIRSLPITLPITDPDVIKTVRATGAAVSDFVRTAADTNTWELQLKRRVIGRVQFQIEFERRGDRSSDSEMLNPVVFPQARQTAYYFAVRTGGRLEIEPANLTTGWQRLDWNMVPPSLRETGNRNSPAVTLRAVTPTAPLALRVIRHSLAEALKLRVAEGTLTTVLSPSGDQLTAVDVTMEVIQRSSLSVQLPEGGELFSIFVNGESVNSIRQSGNQNGWQFYILPGIDDRTAQVRFVYLAKGSDLSQLKIVSPQLNVPLENVMWNVIAPSGFELTHSDGNLELIGEKNEDSYDRQSYLSKVSGKRKAQAEQAAQLLQQASELLQAGEQSKARWALNNVANRYALDAASNEDARVQLENLQTQQAIVGLNTRRQRLFLDNKLGEATVVDNEQFRQAAVANPILQQDQMKFRPQELSQLLAGNTREDNIVLQQIAGRLVQHQRSSEPAPQAIVISLPEEGTVYRFSRGVQVAENAPLELDLQFHSQFKLQSWQWAVVASILGLTAIGLAFSWKSRG